MTKPTFIKKIELIGFREMKVSFNPTYSMTTKKRATFIYIDDADPTPITMWAILSDDGKTWDKRDGETKRLSYENCLKELK